MSDTPDTVRRDWRKLKRERDEALEKVEFLRRYLARAYDREAALRRERDELDILLAKGGEVTREEDIRWLRDSLRPVPTLMEEQQWREAELKEAVAERDAARAQVAALQDAIGTDDEIEAYLNNLPWTADATDHERTLVAGNIRTFHAWIQDRAGVGDGS